MLAERSACRNAPSRAAPRVTRTTLVLRGRSGNDGTEAARTGGHARRGPRHGRHGICTLHTEVPALGRRSIEMIGRLPLGLAVPVIALAACSGGGDGSEPVAPARGESSSEPPTALFVLGDSLSDVGNAAALADWLLDEPFVPRHTVGLCNPADVYVYQRGCDELFFERSRVSDGPVAVEHLAAHLDVPLGASYHTVPERP